ncbi:hypothetical protein M011DRAFT_474072 [Sporormia fimetaria CBS 119925]|uniref:Uncharacterized protein n=1 Tax=Sporormia fimetaria CBS 119925 TaxID=1340428 RepID=A0A6A6VLW7_9PLEO|nr:hypothetical protein M011DRAFT_474072 [Sporormia fimetaria CBS 119925]
MKFSLLLTLLTSSTLVAARYEKCTYWDGGKNYKGVCDYPAECIEKEGGFIIDNRCPGDKWNKCCIVKRGCNGASSYCSNHGGWMGPLGRSQCDWYGGKWLSGKCPGPPDVRCCDTPAG